jgi:hypothetical protein
MIHAFCAFKPSEHINIHARKGIKRGDVTFLTRRAGLALRSAEHFHH